MCWHLIIQDDCINDGSPELQVPVLRESQSEPKNCFVRWSPIQFVKKFTRFACFVSRSKHRSSHGIDCCEDACLFFFASTSESSCSETSFRNGSVIIPRDKIPSIKNGHAVLQAGIIFLFLSNLELLSCTGFDLLHQHHVQIEFCWSLFPDMFSSSQRYH